MKWLVGIDEAGRGPLAGPVAVGVVKMPSGFDWGLLPGVGDSKKVSPANRAAIFRRAAQLKEEGKLDFAVAMSSPKYIDERGIVSAVTTAMARALKRLALDPTHTFIKLDGALKAPAEFAQTTIIKGDQKELVIGLASILAKETRDRYMVRIAKRFAPYDLHIHKGYGTARHRQAIKTHGLSVIHRATYCKNCFL